MKRLRLKLLFICLALRFGISKEVKLSWEELEFAQKYELEIMKDDKVIKNETLSGVDWKGELDYGNYKYRVRGIDQFDRPGIWSDYQDFAIEISKDADQKVKAQKDNENEKLAKTFTPRNNIKLAAQGGNYDYKSQISGSGNGQLNGGQTAGLNGEGTLWFLNRISLSGDASYRLLKVEGKENTLLDYGLSFGYSVINNSRIYFIPSVGFVRKNIPEFSRDPLTLNLQSKILTASGVDAAVSLGFYLSSRFLLGMSASYMKVFNVSNMSSGGSFSSSSPNTFIDLSALLEYAFMQNFYGGLGIAAQHEELGYKIPAGSTELKSNSFNLILSTRLLFDSFK